MDKKQPKKNINIAIYKNKHRHAIKDIGIISALIIATTTISSYQAPKTDIRNDFLDIITPGIISSNSLNNNNNICTINSLFLYAVLLDRILNDRNTTNNHNEFLDAIMLGVILSNTLNNANSLFLNAAILDRILDNNMTKNRARNEFLDAVILETVLLNRNDSLFLNSLILDRILDS